MKFKYTAAKIAGIVLVLLGGLWFLQGSDVVHIKPILCAADCTPITGYEPMWQIIGAVTCLAGGFFVYIGFRSRGPH